jgi:hypothetical protein
MSQHICSNSDCRKIYDISDKDADADFCSFSCWEQVNCKSPQIVKFEEILFE